MFRTVAETGSTNADMAAWLAAGEYLPEGSWLVADRQTAGRGRLGREWLDGAGNFMGSTVVHPARTDPPVSSLALMTGLALHEAIAPLVGHSPTLQLKWPNDVLFGGAKLAGILLEMVAGCVIVGIGVNLTHAPPVPGRDVIAMADIGVVVERDDFVDRLAQSFERELDRWRSAGIAPLLRRWQIAAHAEGTALRVLPPGEGSIEGRFGGLDPDGNLRLKLPDGSLRTIHAGDVSLADPTA